MLETATTSRDWFSDSGASKLRDASTLSFHDLVARGESPKRAVIYKESEEDAEQIELDLARIGPSIHQYLLKETETEVDLKQDKEELVNDELMQQYIAKIRRVLLAYCVRNPRVGYVQGHADLLCFMLANTSTGDNEEEAFWIYATIMEKVFPEDFFARNPKLHGFKVETALLEELITKRLVPHIPRLAEIDLTALTTLLACKWFVGLWVGELPLPLLKDVWEAMLCDECGTIIHLVLALHLVRLAVNAIATIPDGAHWDSSYIYKETLQRCRTLGAIDLRNVLEHANAVYNLSDEGVEDARMRLRGALRFFSEEVRTLLQSVHFQPIELQRLHAEYTYARTFSKKWERQRVRGVRPDFIDNLIVRDFPTVCSQGHNLEI
ncbi:hypothetical protein PINS_up013964 [Pythium insidiosum]|nr:hypothetical protein PINS_up013964 [Pythium insidiosum]